MLGRRLARLDVDEKRTLLDLFTRSAADFLDGWFESDVVKGAFAFDGIVGNYAAPSTPGTAYVLLHHCFGEVNGKRGAWGHAIGGMGAITQAMASSARRRGVDIRTGAKVQEIITVDGAATGVRVDERRRDFCARRGGERRPEAAVPRHAAGERGDAGDARAVHRHEDRLGHLPHERGAERAAGFHLPPAAPMRRITTARASSSGRRSAIWSAPISTRA